MSKNFQHRVILGRIIEIDIIFTQPLAINSASLVGAAILPRDSFSNFEMMIIEFHKKIAPREIQAIFLHHNRS